MDRPRCLPRQQLLFPRMYTELYHKTHLPLSHILYELPQQSTSAIEDLRPNSEHLIDLNTTFPEFAPHISTLSYGETVTCLGGPSFNCYQVLLFICCGCLCADCKDVTGGDR